MDGRGVLRFRFRFQPRFRPRFPRRARPRRINNRPALRPQIVPQHRRFPRQLRRLRAHPQGQRQVRHAARALELFGQGNQAELGPGGRHQGEQQGGQQTE